MCVVTTTTSTSTPSTTTPSEYCAHHCICHLLSHTVVTNYAFFNRITFLVAIVSLLLHEIFLFSIHLKDISWFPTHSHYHLCMGTQLDRRGYRMQPVTCLRAIRNWCHHLGSIQLHWLLSERNKRTQIVRNKQELIELRVNKLIIMTYSLQKFCEQILAK